MRYFFGTLIALIGFSFVACGDSAISGNDNVTTTATAPPIIQKLNDGDNPTPASGGTDCTPTGDPQGTAAKAGDVVKADSCAITEVVDFGAKTVTIKAGKVESDFTVGVTGDVHHNAWVGFETATKAQSDACTSLEPERKSQSTFAGFTVTTTPDCNGGTTNPGKQASTPAPAATPAPAKIPANTGGKPSTGERLTGECSTQVHTDGHIRSVDNGATASKGTLVVLRQVDNADGIEWIEYGCLLNDLTAGKNGLNAHDLWVGYSSVLKAQSDACGQAVGDLRGSKVSGAWNNSYQILFWNGTEFAAPPATCPAR